MASKFHKNAILTGYVDYYCLVCESHMRSEEDADVHIEKPIHKKNLGSAVYLVKFKDDHIWKVKRGYFCEFCNKFMTTTLLKVGLHVAEPKHNNNKGTQLLKRVGNSILMSNNVLINEKAWNGIIGETCVLCNTEFTNEHIHRTEQEHILNAIVKNVEFANENDVFRKVDDSYFQCLTCNLIFKLETLNTHFEDESHIKKGKECRTFTPPTPEQKTLPLLAKTSKELIKDPEQSTSSTVCCSSSADSKTKNDDEPKTSKTEINKVGNSNTTSKATITECDEEIEKRSAKIKNNIGNSKMDQNQNTKAKNKPKIPKCCDRDDSDYETEFNPLLKDSVISAVVKEMKQMWKKDEIPDANKPKDKTPHNNSKQCEKTKILDAVTAFQKNGINVNFENDSVFCKKCFENVDFNYDSIARHIEEHKRKPMDEVKAEFNIGVNKNYSKTDIKKWDLDKNHNETNQKIDYDENTTESSSFDKALVSYTPPANLTNETRDEIPVASQSQAAKANEEPKDPLSYAKANHMTYNKGNNNAYCRICNTRVPANLKNMTEHANGNVHKSKIAKKASEKTIIPKKPMKKFITNRSTVTNMYNDDVIVNDKFCITRMSYLMITENGPRLRCQACEVNLTEDDMGVHLDSYSHEVAMENTPVVWNLHTEFVREVRPGLFHCGFCNVMVGPWEVVDSHLKCTDHMDNKADSGDRLDQHLPGILDYRRFKVSQFMNRSGNFDFGMGGFFF